MKCPYCRADHDRVIDSRAADDGFSIRRRRECLKCLRRYTTYERAEETAIIVVKKDRIREPFDVAKLREGIAKACWKRPVGPQQIDDLISRVRNRLYDEGEMEVESTALGEMVMDALRDVDQVAYLRFASVYRRFTDAHDFAQEVAPMLKPRPPRESAD